MKTEKIYWDKKIETISRDRLQALQLKLLKAQVAHASRNSPYYHGVLPEVDLNKIEDIRKLPFTTKQIIRQRQDALPPFGDMVAVPEKDIVYISASSGSTGAPTASPFTAEDFDEWIDYEARLFWSTGLRSTDRYCHALNFSLFVGGPCVLGAQKLGALSIHAGTVPSEQLLNIMKQFKPTATWTTPSYAWYLGETAIKNGIDPARDLSIRKIFVAGEPGGSIPETRRKIEELWNAEVFDFYGLSDIFGACAGECSERAGLHIAEDHMLVEVLDAKTDEPVGEGERGELVLTTLKKRARPLIRFRTGDIVSYTSEKCKCGRTHLRILGIHGRTDDMLIIKGVNVFPSDIEAIVRDKQYLTGEYRIIVDRKQHLDNITVEVEGKDISNEEIQRLVTNEIKARLGVGALVAVLPQGTLPRATHKAKRVVDKREHVWV